MHVLFFIGPAEWTARARIFAAAAHGLGSRDHEVSIACPPGPIIDHIDTSLVDIVRLAPGTGAALGTFDFRRVAQERSLEVVFVHSTREQLVVGSGLRLAGGGQVVRRLGMFQPRDDEPGLLTARLAPARLLVTTNAECAAVINAGATAPVVAPLGIDLDRADAAPRLDRRELHLRDDVVLIACPYAPNGRVRLLNMMRTLALLAPRHPMLRAVVFGPGATGAELRMQAAALGVAPLVQFIDGAQVNPASLMKCSDIAWIAADHDDAALGCIDAMAAARPVVAERSPAVDYFLADGINGVTLPDGDSATVAAAVASIIARPDARAGYGNAGRMRAQKELGLTPMIDGFERALHARQPVAT